MDQDESFLAEKAAMWLIGERIIEPFTEHLWIT